MTDLIERDPVELLAGYRPTRARLDAEWTPDERAEVRARVLASSSRGPVRWRSRRRIGLLNPAVLSAAAIVALIAGVLIAMVGSTRSDRSLPPATGSGGTVGTGQYAQRSVTGYQIAADGTTTKSEQGTVWAAPDGSLWMNGDLSALGCFHAPAPAEPAFDEPTQGFFDEMPTAPGPLEDFLRAHVSGSSSQDEALFVAVGDMLRNTDLLASAELRAAAVNVLSGVPGVTVHTGVTDYLGRSAVRVDWVNQALRPGEISSMYFDPASYQLLEEQDGSSGAPGTYDGPSPAYTAHETGGSSSPGQLSNPSSVEVMTAESVVDSVPDDVRSCRTVPQQN